MLVMRHIVDAVCSSGSGMPVVDLDLKLRSWLKLKLACDVIVRGSNGSGTGRDQMGCRKSSINLKTTNSEASFNRTLLLTALLTSSLGASILLAHTV